MAAPVHGFNIEFIADWLVKNERTNIYLARRAGVSPGTFNAYLRGDHLPSQKTIEKLAKGIGCDPKKLVKEQGSASINPDLKKLAADLMKLALLLVEKVEANEIRPTFAGRSRNSRKVFSDCLERLGAWDSEGLRKYLEVSGVNQIEFADRVGITRASMTQYLSGTMVPSILMQNHIKQAISQEKSEVKSDQRYTN